MHIQVALFPTNAPVRWSCSMECRPNSPDIVASYSHHDLVDLFVMYVRYSHVFPIFSIFKTPPRTQGSKLRLRNAKLKDHNIQQLLDDNTPLVSQHPQQEKPMLRSRWPRCFCRRKLIPLRRSNVLRRHFCCFQTAMTTIVPSLKNQSEPSYAKLWVNLVSVFAGPQLAVLFVALH